MLMMMMMIFVVASAVWEYKWNDLSSQGTLLFIIFNFPTLRPYSHFRLTLWLESLCGKFTVILCEPQNDEERNVRIWKFVYSFWHTQKLRYTEAMTPHVFMKGSWTFFFHLRNDWQENLSWTKEGRERVWQIELYFNIPSNGHFNPNLSFRISTSNIQSSDLNL